MELSKPKVSMIVVIHNMQREAPRTLFSLSSCYQKELEQDDYEVLIYENGSTLPLSNEYIQTLPKNFRYTYIKNASKSPVFAINQGLRGARGDLIGVMIDGARIVTPGLLIRALEASKTNSRAIISTLGWYLGYDQQGYALQNGYTTEIEDRLLREINWPEDPYRLFEIAVQDQSSVDGWFSQLAESNALFMPRALWQELKGYDERFDLPGGGLANLDILRRANELADTQFLTLIDEASFHQSHGGIATNAPLSTHIKNMKKWREHYENICGHTFEIEQKVNRILYGQIRPEMAKYFARSLIKPIRSHAGCIKGKSLMGTLPFDNKLWSTQAVIEEQYPMTSDSSLNISEVIKLAQEMFTKNRFLETRYICRLLIKKFPNCDEAKRLLRMCANIGNLNLKITTSSKRHASYFSVIAKAHLLLGDIKNAKSNWNKSLALDPLQAQARTGLTSIELPGEDYYSMLGHIHTILCPKLYLEIGVFQGRSLAVAQSPTKAVAVDPNPRINASLNIESTILPFTSDAFFNSTYTSKFLADGIDLAFIDGLHEFQQVVRDFWNTERYCKPNGTIILHDMIPFDELSATKTMQTRWWTGDVWKLLPLLKDIRPDLEISIIRVAPSGLAIIKKLNPNNAISLNDFEKYAKNFDNMTVATFREEFLPKLHQIPNDTNSVSRYFKKFDELELEKEIIPN